MSRLPDDLTLHTDRLLLRPLERPDVDMLWPDMADSEISRLMAWETHRDRGETAAFVNNEIKRRESGSGMTWAILRDGDFCGIVSLIGILLTHRALTYNKAELAYWISRSQQRRGVMTEAGRRVLDFAFTGLRLHKVYVSHFAANQASHALIARLGFRYVGTQRREFQKAGTWHDHVMYELLESEYADLAGSPEWTGTRG